MKNNKEKTLKLLLSTLLVISALLVIILVIIIPDGDSMTSDAELPEKNKTAEKLLNNENKTENSVYSTDNRDQKTAADSSDSSKKTTYISDISSATHPIAEERLLQRKTAVNRKKTASIISRKEKKLYFIIDDAGYNIEQLEAFLSLPGNFTIAVLPGLPHSKESAELIHDSGKQVFLHQPMEALGKNNPGPGAILLGMDNNEIKKTLLDNLNSLPYVSGLNNHMGSAVTSEADMMETILKTAAERKLLFTDSFTTSYSKCKEVAQKLGVTIAKRDVFLDNVDNREAIMESINTGLEIAENKGHAVMIGHVWSSELANTMMEIYPNLIEEGFTLEEMSDLLMGDL